MKQSIRNLIIVSVLLSGFSSFGQDNYLNQLNQELKMINAFDFSPAGAVGSSYFNEDFELAKIEEIEKIYLLRYNAYQDEMEIEKNGVNYFLNKIRDYKITFTGTNKNYQIYEYKDKGKSELGYFVVLSKGSNIALLKREKIKFYEEVKAISGYDKYKPPTLRPLQDKLFIGYINRTTVELPKKKKEILKLFSSKSKEIESFAKGNKIGFKKTADLVEIFNYYNSLN